MLKGRSAQSWNLVKKMLPDTAQTELGASFDDIFTEPEQSGCLPL